MSRHDGTLTICRSVKIDKVTLRTELVFDNFDKAEDYLHSTEGTPGLQGALLEHHYVNLRAMPRIVENGE